MVNVIAQLGERTAAFEYASPNDFATLACIVKLQLGLPQESAIIVRYRDDDGDMITVSTPQELELACASVPPAAALHLTVSAPGYVAPPPVPSKDPDAHAPADLSAAPTAGAASASASAAPEAGSTAKPAAPVRASSNVDVMLNELQYHRIIIQTAVEDVFSKLVNTFQRPNAGREMSESIATFASDAADVIQDVVAATFVQLQARFASLPSPEEIARAVTERLNALGVYASNVLEALRSEIVAALERLYAAVTVRQITYRDAENAVHGAVDIAMEDVPLSRPAAVPVPATAATGAAAAAAASELTSSILSPDAPADLAADLPADMAADLPADLAAAPTSAAAASAVLPTVDVDDTLAAVDAIANVRFEELQASVMPAAPAPRGVRESPSLQASSDSIDVVDTDDFVVVATASSVEPTPAPAAAPAPASAPARPASSPFILPQLHSPEYSNVPAVPSALTRQVQALREMGYPHPTERLVSLLQQANGDVNAVVDQL